MNKKLVNLIILHVFRKVKFFILPAKASEKAPNHFSDSVPAAVTLSLYNSPTDGKYLLHIQKFPLSGILSRSPYRSKLPLDIHPVGDSHLYFRKTEKDFLPTCHKSCQYYQADVQPPDCFSVCKSNGAHGYPNVLLLFQ